MHAFLFVDLVFCVSVGSSFFLVAFLPSAFFFPLPPLLSLFLLFFSSAAVFGLGVSVSLVLSVRYVVVVSDMCRVVMLFSMVLLLTCFLVFFLLSLSFSSSFFSLSLSRLSSASAWGSVSPGERERPQFIGPHIYDLETVVCRNGHTQPDNLDCSGLTWSKF